MPPQGFCVFRAADPTHWDQWLRLWERSPEREPFAHPRFSAAFARPGEEVVCPAWIGEGGGMLLPLTLRSLDSLTWLSGQGTGLRDAVSAYGYGGPWGWELAPGEVESFWTALHAWAGSEAVVSAAVRLPLFDDSLALFQGERRHVISNVVRDLRFSPDELWRDYAHKVRKNVNRARSSGLRVEFDQHPARLDRFVDVYEKTMQRREAASQFFFSKEFFASLAAALGDQALFVYVLSGEAIVSVELALLSRHRMYSFLGGTLEEAFALRPNDLLKHELILWGRETGRREFILGGGYGSDDGIFQYKLSFAPNGVRPFQLGCLAFDPARCDQLTATRLAWEAGQAPDWRPREGFFPAYRSP